LFVCIPDWYVGHHMVSVGGMAYQKAVLFWLKA